MAEIKKIVCFGDSNTHGYNSKTMGRFNEEERWVMINIWVALILKDMFKDKVIRR